MRKETKMTDRAELILRGRHALVSGHRVNGQCVLPGLAYPDLLFRLARREKALDPKDYALERLAILHPLVVAEEGAVRLRVSFSAGKADAWHVQVEGTAVGAAGPSCGARLYATAELVPQPVTTPQRLDIASLLAGSDTSIDLEAVYEKARHNGLSHDGLIRAAGRVHRLSNGGLIEISVEPSAAKDGHEALCHPTLLDAAAMASAVLGDAGRSQRPESLFVPLACDRFRLSGPLGQRCYARIDLDSFRSIQDIRKLDIEFFAPNGDRVATLEGLTAKLARDGLAGQQPLELRSTVAPAPAGEDPLHGFLREVFARYLDQPPQAVSLDAGFYELGMRSSDLLRIVNDIESGLGVRLAPSVLFEYANLRELGVYLKAQAVHVPVPVHGGTEGLPTPAERQVQQERAGSSAVSSQRVDIAVIGLSGRYPKAQDVEQFWENLRNGVDCITEIPASRWDWRRYYGADHVTDDHPPGGKHRGKWGGFIEGVDEFDAAFFNISPDEARALDPQERLFLQQAWAAIEDAGYTRASLASSSKRPDSTCEANEVSVYVGVMYADYRLQGIGQEGAGPVHAGTIANRVSYCLNLNGPSMAVDSLCSSSLAAIHLGCEDLRSGRSRLAIAGGVNITLHPDKYRHLSTAGLLSSSSESASFGRGADGYVPGEGVGAVLLKRLVDAEDDGDQIHGIIRSSVLNHGGKSAGFNVPNLRQQRAVIERALAEAQVDARHVSYIEAHATGTTLGDPVELAALAQAFRGKTADVGFCFIGSAKSNIGHCEGAAGIGALTKVLLQLRQGLIPPSLHAQAANPHIDFATTPFRISHTLQPWPRPVIETPEGGRRELPRIAGLSSFGATGTNAHLVVQEYDPRTSSRLDRIPPEALGRPVLIPLSARTSAQLLQVVSRLLAHTERWMSSASGAMEKNQLGRRSYGYLRDLAFTLQVGREALQVRVCVVASSLDSLRSQLRDWLETGGADCGEKPFPGAASTSRYASEGDPAQAEYRRLATQWMSAGVIEWPHLAEGMGGYRPRRVSLPTYPFERQRHWLDSNPIAARVQDDAMAEQAGDNATAHGSLEAFLKERVAAQLHLSPAQVPTRASLFELGLTSMGIVKLAQEIEARLGVPVSPTVMFEHDCVAALAAHLGDIEGTGARAPRQAPVESTERVASLDQGEQISASVLRILEDLKKGILTPGEARQLIDAK